MTYEKAKAEIWYEHCALHCDHDGCETCIYDKAQEAIEKQIPKKFEIWNGQDCCPNCKALFGSDETRKRLIHWEMDYCKYCGQALKWGD